MSRATLLFCIFFGILNFSWGSSEIPACEDRGPTGVYLDLSEMSIQRISKSLAFGVSVTCLNLEDNDISSIAEESFDSLPTLKYLNLARNRELSFEQLRKTKLPNLKSLVLNGCINTLNLDSNYRNCIELYYKSYNGPQEINNDVLSLPELRKLSLSGNNVPDRIQRFLCVLDTPKLTHLYLSSNFLRNNFNIPNTFNLTHLYLDVNEMDHIPGKFRQSLQHLSMDYNVITELCGLYCKTPSSMTLRNMDKLRFLSLAYNKIQDIDVDAFDYLENLLFLNLAGNQITHFRRHAFDNITSLKNLTLDNNKLTTVPIICALKQLEVLSLKGNKITSFNATAFCDLPKLASLDLSDQGLTSIADGTFTKLGALSELDLSSNGLHSLSANWISRKNLLKVLHLDRNEFVDINSMYLEHLGQVEILSFGHNPLKMISVKSLSKLPSKASIDASRDCSEF